MPGYIFYPEGHPEIVSVDGRVGRVFNGTWSSVRNGVGTFAEDSANSIPAPLFDTGAAQDVWGGLQRGILVFDTSDLPDDTEINNATLSLRGSAKIDNLNILPNINIYSAAPASGNELIAADYGTLGTTPFSDTPITYEKWITNGYNDFPLNAAGKANISKAGLSYFGVRNANYDVANIEPTWSSNTNSSLSFTAREAGIGGAPKLVINAGIPGFIWGESTPVHFIDEFGFERTVNGQDVVLNGEAGFVYVTGVYLYWVDQNGDVRREVGTKLGATGAESGHIWVEGTRLHYIDENGDERFLPIEGFFNSSVYNQLLFNG